MPWFREKQHHLFYDYCTLIKQKRGIFFQENFNLKELFYLTVAMRLFGKKEDRLWLVFRYDFSMLRGQGRWHRLLLRILGARVQLFTDSALIAQDLAGATLLPIPHMPRCDVIAAPTLPICCWWPGEPREAKGRREIMHLLSHRDARYEMVFSEELPLPPTTRMKSRQLSPILPRSAYERQFSVSDVILLPYDKGTYKSSTSGILVEAVIAGKVPLIKEGGWLAYELRRFGLEELIVDWDDPNFFDTIYPLLFSNSVREKLAAMQQEYIVFHSKENFGKIFMQQLGSGLG